MGFFKNVASCEHFWDLGPCLWANVCMFVL